MFCRNSSLQSRLFWWWFKLSWCSCDLFWCFWHVLEDNMISQSDVWSTYPMYNRLHTHAHALHDGFSTKKSGKWESKDRRPTFTLILRHFSEKHIMLSFVIIFRFFFFFLVPRWRNNKSCFDVFCMFWKIKWFHGVTYEACILCIIDYVHMLVHYMTAFPNKKVVKESQKSVVAHLQR